MSSIELQEIYQLEFMKAALDGLNAVLDYLKEGNLNQHQLIECAKTALISNYDVKIVVAILAYIDDVNYVDPGEDTLIQIAASMGNYPIVMYLVMKGAKINLSGIVLQPIVHAIIANDYMIVAYLLMHGAFIDNKIQDMLKHYFPLEYNSYMKIYEKYQELYKSFKENNKDYLTNYIVSGTALTKSHWKHIKKVFPQHFSILYRLYSRIQFVKKKIPDKYKSEVEGLKSRITLGNLSQSLNMFDRDYTALRDKHSGLRFSMSSVFKMSMSPLPELPID
jgi:hypothetical protein